MSVEAAGFIFMLTLGSVNTLCRDVRVLPNLSSRNVM